MKRIILTLFLFLILIFVAARTIDLQKTYQLLLTFPKLQLLTLTVILMLISLIKAWRFQILLNQAGVKITFIQTTKVYLAGQATTSLPAGETIRGWLLKKEVGAKLSQVSGPVLTQAFFEFISASIIFLSLSMYFGVLRRPAVAALAVVIILVFILINEKLLNLILRKLERVSFIKKQAKALHLAQETIRNAFLKPGTKRLSLDFLKVLSIGVLTNALGGLLVLLILNAFKLDFNLLKSVFVYSSSTVLSSVSGLIPAGLGVTEGGMTGVLYLTKVDTSTAFASVLIFRLITLVFYMLIGIFCLLIFYRKDIFKKT